MIEPFKRCVDCEHAATLRSYEPLACYHEKSRTTDVIGFIYYLSQYKMRKSKKLCGRDGKFFEKKIAEKSVISKFIDWWMK